MGQEDSQQVFVGHLALGQLAVRASGDAGPTCGSQLLQPRHIGEPLHLGLLTYDFGIADREDGL